jgi:hypothetical protein
MLPQNPTPAIPEAPVVAGAQPATARQMYDAARAFRSELRNQLDRQEELRENLRSELTDSEGVTPADRAGIEARIKEVDARISSLDQQIAAADARVAAAAAVPGATVDPPRPRDPGPPEEFWVLSGVFIIFVMMPVAVAYARRLWKRAPAPAGVPQELSDRLGRIEEAVDAVAVELERVGEGQRYVTKVIGAGGAEALVVRQQEAARQARP